MRMIQEFAQVLARISALARSGNLEEARESLQCSLKDWFDLDSDSVHETSDSELRIKLMSDGPTSLAHAKCVMLAGLIRETGLNLMARNQNEKGIVCQIKALDLLLRFPADDPGSELPQYDFLIEELRIALKNFPLPSGTLAVLMEHHERHGQFSRAEDCLFELLEAVEEKQAVHQLGEAFYKRLSGKTDGELEAGMLSRQEVVSGLKDLLAVMQ